MSVSPQNQILTLQNDFLCLKTKFTSHQVLIFNRPKSENSAACENFDVRRYTMKLA